MFQSWVKGVVLEANLDAPSWLPMGVNCPKSNLEVNYRSLAPQRFNIGIRVEPSPFKAKG